jgi:hypothetical protein
LHSVFAAAMLIETLNAEVLWARCLPRMLCRTQRKT